MAGSHTPVQPVSSPSLPRRLAAFLADSALLGYGHRLMKRNEEVYSMPLSKWQKVWAGVYLILRDYSTGLFPPTFADQKAAYEAEMNFYSAMPGIEKAEAIASHIQKPFWTAYYFGFYSSRFTRLAGVFESVGLKAGSRMLELGCGSGWTAEFLAIMGYKMVATTIGPDEVAIGEKRIAALKARGIGDEGRLAFRQSPMETVDKVVADQPPFDGVFVFEALHHAYDWRQTIHTAYRCTKPGGWFIVADEPNLLHTFISYRVGRLTNTHEIGMSRRDLLAEMKKAGFRTTRIFSSRFDNRISHLWLGAQK